jgi:hypothetical protein
MENTIPSQVKNGFRMQVSVAYLSFFARIGDEKILPVYQ